MLYDYLKFMVILMAIDTIWLYGNFSSHKKQFESVQKSPLIIDKVAGISFYIIAAIAYFKFVKPYSRTREDSFKNGALMGFLLFASFDLTNKAVFTDYKWDYAIKDILWGTFASGLASYIIYSTF